MGGREVAAARGGQRFLMERDQAQQRCKQGLAPGSHKQCAPATSDTPHFQPLTYVSYGVEHSGHSAHHAARKGGC